NAHRRAGKEAVVGAQDVNGSNRIASRAIDIADSVSEGIDGEVLKTQIGVGVRSITNGAVLEGERSIRGHAADSADGEGGGFAVIRVGIVGEQCRGQLGRGAAFGDGDEVGRGDGRIVDAGDGDGDEGQGGWGAPFDINGRGFGVAVVVGVKRNDQTVASAI